LPKTIVHHEGKIAPSRFSSNILEITTLHYEGKLYFYHKINNIAHNKIAQ
jgi:hypothetical protein